VLIGSAADLLLLWNGDVMGASGIATSALLTEPLATFRTPAKKWKLAFLATFLCTATFGFGRSYFDNPTYSSSDSWFQLSNWGFALGGLLVGFGTRLGNGCTSGHGICGLGRSSVRSLSAVLTFLTTGVVTTTVLYGGSKSSIPEFLVRAPSSSSSEDDRLEGYGATVSVAVATAAAIATAALFLLNKKPSGESGGGGESDPLVKGGKKEQKKKTAVDVAAAAKAKLLPSVLGGGIFASGLYLSGMVYQSKVYGFLNVSSFFSSGQQESGDAAALLWDPSLMMVMAGGVLVSFVGYQLVDKFRYNAFGGTDKSIVNHPLALPADRTSFSGIPTNTTIDWQLLGGAFAFGLGWGVAGICPGPALFMAGVGHARVLTCWWPSYAVGAYIATELKKK